MMRVILPYTAPYDWAAMTQFLAARATPGVERVDDAGYRRTIAVRGCFGSIAVAPLTGGNALTVDVSIANPGLVPAIVERVAGMFDVDSDPTAIADCLSRDRLLKGACVRHAGIRLPGAWDPFELAVRAVLGQQISVRAATTMAGRVAARWGDSFMTEHDVDRLFPSPAMLADAPLEETGIIAARAKTIRELAQRVVSGRLVFASPAVMGALLDIPGIGPWTAQYIAMRAMQHSDAFPSGDLVLRRVAGHLSARALNARSERWRPWRAYAVMLLWQAANDKTTSPLGATDANVDATRRPRAARGRPTRPAARAARAR